MIFKNWPYRFNFFVFVGEAQSALEEQLENEDDVDIDELIKNFINRKRANKN